MSMSRDTLEGLLSDAFPDADITLTDLAGDNDHWQAEIVSEDFRGKT
ncbi:MAG: BolA family transcriptional regulator, partial [Henriciella sp.]